MSFRNARRQMSNQVARTERNQLKLQKLRDRVRQSTKAFLARQHARLAWWQSAFGTPIAGVNWMIARASSLWAAFLALLGFSGKSFSSSASRRPVAARRSMLRLAMVEGLEQRQLMTADITSVLLDPTSNSGSTSDTTTNVTSAIYNVGYDNLFGPEQIQIRLNNTSGALLGSGTITGLATPGTKAITVDLSSLPDGTHTLLAFPATLAGLSKSTTVTIDRTAPVAPVVALTSDTGSSSSDNISSVGTLNVTLSDGGVSSEFSLDGTVWSPIANFKAVENTLNSIKVRQVDSAGNPSSPTAFAFTFDTTAVQSTPDLTASSDSGSSNSDDLTNATTPTFTFSLDNNSKVDDEIKLFDGTTLVGTAKVTAGDITAGKLSITSSALGGDVTRTFTAKLLDLAGNTATSSALTVKFDGSAPVVQASAISVTDKATPANIFTVDDTVFAEWTDPETDVVSVAFNFSSLGGPAAATGTKSGNKWSASHKIAITDNFVDATGLTVTVAATDKAGNTASDSKGTFTVDNRPLTVSTVSVDNAFNSGAKFKIGDTLRVSWDKKIDDSAATDVPVGGVTADLTSIGGKANETLILLGNGKYSADVVLTSSTFSDVGAKFAVTAIDDAGNKSIKSVTYANGADLVRPTLSSASFNDSDNKLKSTEVGEVRTLTLNFSEDMDQKSIPAISFAAGGAFLTSPTAGTWVTAKQFTRDYTIAKSVSQVAEILVDVSGTKDVIGNSQASSTNNKTGTSADMLNPTVANVVIGASPVLAGTTPTVTITFSEPTSLASGFTAATVLNNVNGIQAGGGTLSNLQGDGTNTWKATFTPTVGLESTTNVVSINKASFKDDVGLAGTINSNSSNYAVDTIAPSVVSITSSKSAFKIGDQATVTIVFSQPINPASLSTAISKMTADNAVLSNLQSSDSKTFTVTLNPNSDVESGTNVVSVLANGYADPSGNTGPAKSSANYTIDTKAPSLVITMGDTDLTIGQTSVVTFAFSEKVQGFTKADVNAPNGTISDPTSSDDNKTFTAVFTPTAGITAPANQISVTNSVYTDVILNDGKGASGPSYSIDNVQAKASSISLSDTDIAIGEAVTVTVSFSEPVDGSTLTISDFNVGGGTLSSLKLDPSDSSNKTWKADFNPTSNFQGANNLITLPDGSFTDAKGNPGLGTTSGKYVVDLVAPAPFVSSSVTSPSNSTAIPVTINFNEDVVFSTAMVTVTNGSIPTAVVGTKSLFTFNVVPNGEGTVSVSFNAKATTDAVGNPNTPSNVLSIVHDITPPTVSTLNINKSTFKKGDTGTVTIEFSEVINDSTLTVADFTVENGALSALTKSTTNAKSYTATFTPTDSVEIVPTNFIKLDIGKFSDIAGNQNAAAKSSNPYGVNTKNLPVLTPSKVSTNVNTFSVTVNFGEAVTGFALDDLILTNANPVTKLNDNGSGNFSFDVTAQALGDVTIQVKANAAFDSYSNDSEASKVLTVSYDKTAPEVISATLSGTSPVLAGQTRTATFVFSEKVSDPSAFVSKTGGSLGSLSTTDSGVTWTAIFTPTEPSDTTGNLLSVSAGYTDLATNPGTKTVTSSAFAVDTFRPEVIVNGLTVNKSILNNASNTATLKIEFNQPIDLSSLSSSDFTLTGVSIGAFSKLNATDNIYTATLTANPDFQGTGSVQLNASKVLDPSGNSNSAAASTATFNVDAKAPTVSDVIALVSGGGSGLLIADNKLTETLTVTVSFSENMAGATPTLTFTNGVTDVGAANLKLQSSSWVDLKTYKAIYQTKDANQDHNAVTVTVSGASDENGNTQATHTGANNRFQIDTFNPDVTNNKLTASPLTTTTITTLSANDGPTGSDPSKINFSLGSQQPGNGEFRVSGVSKLTFTAAELNSGSVTFVSNTAFGSSSTGFTVSDEAGNTTIGSFVVQTTFSAPNAGDDTVANGLIVEDTIYNANASIIAANDSDPEGNTLTYFVLSQPTKGNVIMNANGSFRFTPNANETGADSFSYRVLDGFGGIDDAVVSFNIGAVNDAPTAVGDTKMMVNQSVLSISPLDNDSDIDGPTLSITQVDGSSSFPVNVGLGTVSKAGQELHFTPFPGAVGTQYFTYTVSDGTASSQATVTISVASTNNPPTAPTTNASGNMDQPITGTLLGTDPDNDVLSYLAQSQASNGTVVVTGKTFVYTPNAGFTGGDSFTYRVLDGRGGSAVGTVNLTVNALTGPAPTVSSLLVNSNTWSTAFKARPGLSTLGYATASNGPTLPWIAINEINVQFSTNVGASLSPSDFALTGVSGLRADGLPGSVPTITGVTFDALTNTARLSLSSALDASTLTLRVIASGVFDAGGRKLASDYLHVINVLPGDVNQNDSVTGDDQLGLNPFAYTIFKDVNGSSTSDSADSSLISLRTGSRRVI